MYCCNNVGNCVSGAARNVLSQTIHNVDKSYRILMTALVE